MSQRSLNTRQTRILIALIPTLVSSCNSEQLIPLEQAMIPKPHKTITITIRHYCPQANGRFVDLYATQLSYLIERAQPRMDFDRDGVPNSHDSNVTLNLGYPDCTHFTVSNIHLIEVPNGNLIEFAFIEEELNTHHRRFEGTKRVVVPRTTEGSLVTLALYARPTT